MVGVGVVLSKPIFINELTRSASLGAAMEPFIVDSPFTH